MNTKDTIQQIKTNGYPLDFSAVFNQTFENYKKIALNSGLAMILLTILFCFFFGILAVGVFGLAISAETMADFKVENLSPIWFVGYLFFIMVLCILASPINAGLIKMARSAQHGEAFSVLTIFDYYRGPYFKEIVMATVVITFFSTTLSMGLQWVGFPILGMLISFSVSILTFLTLPLIIFGNLNAMEAIEGSIVAVSKQFLLLFALLIVGFIFVMLGFIGFCVGIFFTMPFMYSMYYIIYREIFTDHPQTDTNDTLTTL
ncbi:hypothetical protein G4D82_13495 [Flavobacterium sp. CYK-4]|uniref:hypothetical protein n=1 Tax=Flavobacterium lotistagni TaxID=2709660 RepID=UPI00140D1138|nr:hypothetical protein [Flavobacterium lotistagni]NHM08238.1 hypothetical protein [Flavobacterium lotistagni]